jgi:hypothetical protein
VCSEVAAYFLMKARLMDYWKGVTPAMLENDIRNQPNKYTITFEGVFDSRNQ